MKKEHAVFTFGRMNPPTAGHFALIDKVNEVSDDKDADSYVFLSQTVNDDNPLTWQDKEEIIKHSIRANVAQSLDIKTPFAALEHLAEHYKKITLVVGSDRLELFKDKMKPYATDWGVVLFEVISSGQRDPDAGGISSVSASAAREFAKEDDFSGFMEMMDDRISNDLGRAVFNKIRVYYSLDESPDELNKEADEYRRKGERGIFAYQGWG